MKKVLVLLVICAMAAPAFAGEVTLLSTDNGDGTATVSMTVVSGEPVGIGLDVATDTGVLDDAVMAVDSFFDIFIDAAYDMETATPGSYTYGAGDGPVCLIDGPGATTVAAANTAGTGFALCVGGLGGETAPAAAGPQPGDTVAVFVLSASETTSATITLNDLRGGIVVKDGSEVTVNGLPLTVTITTGPTEPPCWSCPGQNLGDANGDGQINLADLFALKAAFGTDDPATDFNRDGAVNLGDLFVLKANFGKTVDPCTTPCP